MEPIGDKAKALRLVEKIKDRIEREVYWNAISYSHDLNTELSKLFDDVLKCRAAPTKKDVSDDV